MKKAFCIAAIFTLVVAICGTTALAADVTVKGKVEEASKDTDGRTTSVVIVTESGKVAVENDAVGEQLLYKVGKRVKATGTETTAEDGSRTLTVKSFRVVRPRRGSAYLRHAR